MSASSKNIGVGACVCEGGGGGGRGQAAIIFEGANIPFAPSAPIMHPQFSSISM